MIDTHETLVEAKKAAEVLAKSTIKRMKDTERPNIEAMKANFSDYGVGELRLRLKTMIEYIESRGQARTEEEIREQLIIKPISEYWKGYLACAEWALEDSEPKHEHFRCPQCHEVWHNEYNMLHRCCPPGEPEPKPIEKIALKGSNTRTFSNLADKIDEIIDRLNEIAGE
ncbi:hypothetical protein LCGC14_1995360 [marine sediment metagenome]|uniref:Uncharacterized protein n=1 Tax=marine sediment metagenome TaxID=412755 RepID=A0A0F9I1Y6_9ZZZZ